MVEPLVLLPPMMSDARVFLHQIAEFSRERAVQVAPITLGETVEDMANAVLDAAPANFALVGLAMGGIVAMEVQRRAPERVTRLALMDTNAQSETPTVAAAREAQIVKAKAGRLEEVMRDEMQPHYLAPGPHRAEILNLVMDMALDFGPEVFTRQSRALQRRPDQQKTLRMLRIPTLVMCGVHDELTPIRRHEFMATLIPNAKLEVISEAGHLPTLEQPGEVIRHLHDWLAQPAVQPLVLRDRIMQI